MNKALKKLYAIVEESHINLDWFTLISFSEDRMLFIAKQSEGGIKLLNRLVQEEVKFSIKKEEDHLYIVAFSNVYFELT